MTFSTSSGVSVLTRSISSSLSFSMFPWLAFVTEVFMETVPFIFCCRRIVDYSIKTGKRSFLREYNILLISTRRGFHGSAEETNI